MLSKLKFLLDIIYRIAKVRKTKPVEKFRSKQEDATQVVTSQDTWKIADKYSLMEFLSKKGKWRTGNLIKI